MMDLIIVVYEGDKEKVEELVLKNGIPIDSKWTDYLLLRTAIRRGHTDIFKFLVGQGCRVNKITKSTVNTLLHIAVSAKYVELVKLLLEKGASIYQKNHIGETPPTLAVNTKNEEIIDLVFEKMDRKVLEEFHIACITNRLSTVEKLIRSGVSVNKPVPIDSPFWPSYTPLHFAVLCDREKIVETLLRSGADLNVKDSKGITALRLAVQLIHSTAELHAKESGVTTDLYFAPDVNSSVIVDLMLGSIKRRGHYDNPADNRGLSHFHIACMRSDPAVVEGFLKHGVEIDGTVSEDSDIWSGYTPLHFAVEYERVKVIKLLLQYGADVSLRNGAGRTPLHIAVGTHHPKILDLIVASLSNCSKLVNQIDNHGLSHFHVACMTNNWRVVLAFLEQGENVNQQVYANSPKKSLYTPLHFAAENKREETVKVLLEHGADPNAVEGMTPLHVAAAYKVNKNIVRMLLENGADVNAYSKTGKTILHMAIERGSKELVKLLIQHKADVNCATKIDLMTPLHCAARVMAREIINILLREGADPSARTINGETALHLIMPMGSGSSDELEYVPYYSKIIRAIVDAGCDIDSVDVHGYTPLRSAYVYSNSSCTYALLQHGANIHLADNTAEVRRYTGCESIFDEHRQKLRVLVLSVSNGNSKSKDLSVSNEDSKSKDLSVSNENSKSKDLSESNEDSKSKDDQETDFSRRCQDELNRMQAFRIDSYSSLYDIIFKSPTELAFHVLNDSLTDLVESKEFDKDFPLYGYLIRLQLKKGAARIVLFDPAKDAFETLIGLGLPNCCFESIAKYLTDEELKDLINTTATID